MNYVGGETREDGCIFCNRLNSEDDVKSLILHRFERCFVIMNLYPYNTGHIMIVPNQHTASPEEVDLDTLAEMATLLPLLLRSLRRVLSCHGFNVGLNVGSIAGAGVAEHMHQHIVPRWSGDANFMPILGSAMVIPELIPASYAKVRAEIERELLSSSEASVTLVVIDPKQNSVLLDFDARLPTLRLQSELPVWRQAVDILAATGVKSSVGGWAGKNRSGGDNGIAVTLIADSSNPPAGAVWQALDSEANLVDADSGTIHRAIAQLAPLFGRS